MYCPAYHSQACTISLPESFSLLLQELPQPLSQLTEHAAELQTRRLAVECYFEAKRDMAGATALFNKKIREHLANKVSYVHRYIMYQLNKWTQQSGVHDRPKPEIVSASQLIVDDEVARQFAYKLAHGHAVHIAVDVNGQLVESYEHRQFYTLDEAVEQDAYIRMVVESGVNVRSLMRRAHELDPQLGWFWQHIREPKTAAQLAERKKYSNDQLQRVRGIPNYLLDTFWMDEIRIYIAQERSGKVRVWGHRRELNQQPPTVCPLLDSGRQLVLNLMIVSNARYGIIWCDTLTGTSWLDGEQWKIEQLAQGFIRQRDGNYYKVSYSLTKQDGVQCFVFCHAASWQLCSQPGSV